MLTRSLRDSPIAMSLLSNLPMPTLDRPFGIALWPYFDKAFGLVMGFDAHDFDFRPGHTPLSSFPVAFGAILFYYAVIFGGREFMRNRKPFKLTTLFLAHNLILTVISGILLVLFFEQVLSTVFRNGIFYSICVREGGYTQPLIVLYYVRYTLFLPWSCLSFVMGLLTLPVAQLLD